MKKFLFPGLVGLLLLVLAACGSSATAVPAAKQAPAAPAAAAAPAAKAAPAAVAAPAAAAQPAAPAAVAAPAAPAAGPTKLTSKGKWDFQLAWVSRTTDGFRLTEQWVKRISDRTNGAINIKLVSYPELGIGGTDSLQQMKDGTIPFLELFSGYIGGDLPFADMNSLFGMYENSEIQLKAMDAVKEEMAREIDKQNGVIISYAYYPDFYIYSKKPLTKVSDFKGLKMRAHTPALADLASGLGAEGLWLAFSEMYTALERGVFQAGITVTDAGYGQRWYEVTNYLYGPIIGYPQTWVTMNKDVWKKLPPDVQAILLEEGQWREQEARRNTIRDTEKNLKLNTDAGMKYSDFSPEVKAVLKDTAINVILPNWVKKVGGPDSEAAKIFNAKISPILGVKVNPDGTASYIGKAPAAPAAVAKPAAPAAVAAPISALAKYAAEHAGKPGAIYVGDINQLVGPAPSIGEGDFDGNVPLDSLLRHRYVYESAGYKALLEKAKLTNPTPLVYTGESITIQHACLNRTLLPCKLYENFFVPNLLARTKGKLNLTISSYPELGISGTDNVQLIAQGTLAMTDIVGPFVAGHLPALEIQYLFGAFTEREPNFFATMAIGPDVQKLLEYSTEDGKHINRNWYSGNDFFFFTKKPLRTLEDFKGKKTRAFGPAISDWIIGMGAQAQFVAFAESYTALERGILDMGVTGGVAGYGQRWYEVTKYINGPLISWPSTDNVMNKKVWEKLPPDLQAILIEEGAKSELEALRIAAIQNEMGREWNTKKGGMEYLEFSPELRAKSDAAVLERVIPLWAKRTGGPDAPFVKIFNEKIGPLAGYRINPDGSASKVPAVKAK